MVLVSHRKRFIYTKTVKTAGTSIEGLLGRYCVPEGSYVDGEAYPETVTPDGIIGARDHHAADAALWVNHMSAAAIAEAVGPDNWQAYLKITSIRDPYTKILSLFFFNTRRQGIDLRAEPLETQVRGFRDTVQRVGVPVDRDKYVIEDRVCIDRFLRFETLEADLQALCREIDVPFDPGALPQYKRSKDKGTFPLDAFYDRKTAKIVERAYSFEFEQFGYDKLDFA